MRWLLLVGLAGCFEDFNGGLCWEDCGNPNPTIEDSGPPTCAELFQATCGPKCMPAGSDCCSLEFGFYCLAGDTCINVRDSGVEWECANTSRAPCEGGQFNCGIECGTPGGGCCSIAESFYCSPSTVCQEDAGGWSCVTPSPD